MPCVRPCLCAYAHSPSGDTGLAIERKTQAKRRTLAHTEKDVLESTQTSCCPLVFSDNGARECRWGVLAALHPVFTNPSSALGARARTRPRTLIPTPHQESGQSRGHRATFNISCDSILSDLVFLDVLQQLVLGAGMHWLSCVAVRLGVQRTVKQGRHVPSLSLPSNHDLHARPSPPSPRGLLRRTHNYKITPTPTPTRRKQDGTVNLILY